MTTDRVIHYARELIRYPSVTPDDAGCQPWLADKLGQLGFTCEHLRYGEVDNLWARRGTEGPLFVFAGHTDVVPPGDLDAWDSQPFSPDIRDGLLYGRGAADMKSSIAAMLVAVEEFIDSYPDHKGSIGFLITSDEEGPAVDGTLRVVEHLESRGEKIDWCLVGEPSSSEKLGDVIKNGRRGSLGARLTIHGVQGHVAYPHLARNPVHEAMPALAKLASVKWDRGNRYFPATSFQISNINAGTGATNVIPGQCEVLFNFRFSTEVTADQLIEKTESILLDHNLEYDIQWTLSGEPFLTAEGELVSVSEKAITDVLGYVPQLSTAGGTSDGRFIAPTGAQVLELGPVNASIHKINECTPVDELLQLPRVYQRIVEALLT